MEFFQKLFEKLKDRFIINSYDSDEVKAKKELFYYFILSIAGIFVVSYIIFVVLTFSTKSFLVPNLLEDNIYKALRKLSDYKVNVRINSKYSSQYPEGIVIAQNPKQGTSVKEGRTVTLTISLGDKEKTLPDFTGMSLFDIADYILQKYPNDNPPYKFGEKIYEFNDKVEFGRVFKQEPPEGTPLKSVKKVKLYISNGEKLPDTIVLGNYTGKNIIEVLPDIEKYELNIKINFVETSKKEEHNIIKEQNYPENYLVDEINKINGIFELTIFNYSENKKDLVKDKLNINLPKTQIPYRLSILFTVGNNEYTELFGYKTKGGYTLEYPYSVKNFSKIIVKKDDEVLEEFKIEKK